MKMNHSLAGVEGVGGAGGGQVPVLARLEGCQPRDLWLGLLGGGGREGF